YTYKTVGMIEGVKVLEGIDGVHGLPVESHSSSAYISLDKEGTFREIRFYDENHYVYKEIAYTHEGKLTNGNLSHKVLHIHVYTIRDDFSYDNRKPRLLTDEEYEKYKKYFIEVPENARR
ncbi:MAG: hypothetical protein LUD51_00840, partial [Clostridia bacterium]|nr:hypothetical protein [Clostridia bacterium]